MGKPRYEAKLKLKIVEDCLGGRNNPNHVMNTQGIAEKTVRRWIARYKAESPTAYLTPEKNKRYSSELKKQVVEEYLSGESSILELMSKYAIRAEQQIRDWIKIYNVMCRETTLSSYIDTVKNRYDYIIIDCMPSLGMITLNALTAALRYTIWRGCLKADNPLS